MDPVKHTPKKSPTCTIKLLQAIYVCHMLYWSLYHAIENTANQNSSKLLYIRQYYTQPSHCALRSYSRQNLVSIFSMTWLIVTQHFLVVYLHVTRRVGYNDLISNKEH